MILIFFVLIYKDEKSTDSGHLSSLDKYSKSIDSLLPSNLIKCPGLSIDIIDKISEMNLNVISTLEANEKRLQNRNRVLADMSRNCMELKYKMTFFFYYYYIHLVYIFENKFLE
jgi:hypothetical protein